jgi:hypothetical protein
MRRGLWGAVGFTAFGKIRFVSCRMCNYTAAVYSFIQKVQLHSSCIQRYTESAATLQLYTALYRKCSYTAAVYSFIQRALKTINVYYTFHFYT